MSSLMCTDQMLKLAVTTLKIMHLRHIQFILQIIAAAINLIQLLITIMCAIHNSSLIHARRYH